MNGDEVMFECPKCKTKIKREDDFCPVCGLEVDMLAIEIEQENKSHITTSDELVTKSWVSNGNIFIERKSHLSERILSYLRDLCTFCGMCVEVCPKNCIELNVPTDERQPLITIDPDECFLCGICSEICLFNALDIQANGKSLKHFEGTPHYSPTYEIDLTKCPSECRECEAVCSRKAIDCTKGFERDGSRCIYCSSCALACPEDAIIVEKVFTGEISLDTENCQTCGVCVDVCPTGAIYFPKLELGQDVERIKVDEERCIYCGACEKVCPIDVISVIRKDVNYSVEGKNPWTKTHKDAFKKTITNYR